MLPAVQQICYGNKRIAYHLFFSARRSLGVKVMPDGSVHVTAPLDAKTMDVAARLKSKAGWIIKQQIFFEKYKPTTPRRRFVNGETHLYLGRQYQLKLFKGDCDEVNIYRGVLVMKTKNTDRHYLQRQLNDWYKEKALLQFGALMEDCLLKFKRYKISAPTLHIRRMQKRWGSCTVAGKIILNTHLIMAPKASIEYVIMHELCHLVHRNHTRDFFALQQRLFPDWEKWKEKLECTLA